MDSEIVILWYVVICCDMLWYVMLWYVINVINVIICYDIMICKQGSYFSHPGLHFFSPGRGFWTSPVTVTDQKRPNRGFEEKVGYLLFKHIRLCWGKNDLLPTGCYHTCMLFYVTNICRVLRLDVLISVISNHTGIIQPLYDL
jgi:hypothetical protein